MTRRAFSLIEVVIAMAILAIGIFGAVRVFPVGLQASRRSETSSRAAMAASRILESLKLKSCAEIVDGETTAEGMTLATRVTSLALPHVADAARLKGIEVTARWQQDNRARSQIFVTYVRCATS